MLADDLVSIAGDADKKPDAIVGGFWPAVIPGSRRISCLDCGKHVALCPDSGGAIAALWPDVPIVCIDCVRERAQSSK
jgi:hypothetical protein